MMMSPSSSVVVLRSTRDTSTLWAMLLGAVLMLDTVSNAQALSGTYSYRLLSSQGPCDFVKLVRCFIDVLDDWAWSLWSIKDNIAIMNGEACQHHRVLGDCVFFDDCSRQDVLEASSIVTDLLSHHKGSSSFLKSYFLADFSCTAEGQSIIKTHRHCLLKQHIGDQAMEVATYVETKLRQIGDNSTEASLQQCELLKEQAEMMRHVGRSECPPSGGLLMCRSLVDSFVYLYPNRFEFCDISCYDPTSTTVPEDYNDLSTDFPGATGDEEVFRTVAPLPSNHNGNAGVGFLRPQLLTFVALLSIVSIMLAVAIPTISGSW